MRSIIDIPWTQIEASFKPWNANTIDFSDTIYSVVLDRFAHSHCKNKTNVEAAAFVESAINQRVGGTLKGLTENLMYIKELGISTLLLNPFLQNQTTSYHGYAIIDFLKVDEQLGTTEDLIELVRAAHQLEIKVIFDCVLNHAGDVFTYYAENSIFNESFNYSIKNWKDENPISPVEFKNVNLFERKGRIVHWDKETDATLGDIFELKTFIQNPSNPSGAYVLDVMVSVYLYWAVITNADGYRIDALKHLNKEFIEMFVKRVDEKLKALGKTHFNFVGEYIYTDSKVVENKFSFDLLNFEFYFFANNFNRKQKLRLKENETHYIFLENHDQIGFYPKQRFNVGRTQNEIFIWWRFLSLMPHSVPMYYYGSEQGLKGKGVLDASVREPLFDLETQETLLDENAVGYQALRKIIKERRSFVSSFMPQAYELTESDNLLLVRDSKGAVFLIFNTSKKTESIEGLFFENNLSIHKKNVYLFQDESYKEFLGDEALTSMPPFSILLLTNHYE